jgi:type II secretory pathway pseudopilin PulG
MGITKKSFTLIELVVAVGVVGLILPTVFNIFFTMIRQQLVLVAYQEMKQQGDSVQRNIKNLLQDRAAYITDSLYTATDVCPLPITPTPTNSPQIYINDRDGRHIRLYQKTVSSVDTVASDSATKSYNLTSSNVTISDVGFTCYKTSDFTPPYISAKFTIHKSTIFNQMSLPYEFKTKLRTY